VRARLTPDALLLAGVLLLTLGIAIFAVRSGRTDEEELGQRRTTYSPRPGGYQAVYETLAALHYPVQRWRRPFDALSGRGTLIVAQPESAPTPAEWQALADWVSRGNLLIYLTDRGIALPELMEQTGQPEPPEQTSRPAQPSPPAAVAPDLRTRAGYHLDPAGPDFEAPTPSRPGSPVLIGAPLLAAPRAALYQDPQGATVTYARWGSGAVLRCSSPWSLATSGLRAGDNFPWLLATLAAYGPRSGIQERPTSDPEHLNTRTPEHLNAIWFDEYHHGYAEGRGVLSLLAPIARLGLAQLVIAWLLLTYAASRRFGGRVPDEGRVRRSRSEYLGSMAELLRRARATDLAIVQVRRQFLHDVSRALGLPRDPEPAALLAAAGTRGVDPEQLRSLLDRAERLAAHREQTRPEEALVVARELVRLRQAISGQRSAVSDQLSAVSPGNVEAESLSELKADR
jgi:hypothetical protein